MVPDPELAEPGVTEQRLGPLDLRQSSGCDRQAVREPARQARARRLVPGGQPQRPGQRADIRLRKARFPERRPYTAFLGGRLARAVVRRIVGVGPVHHRAQVPLGGDPGQTVPQLRLAVVAPVRGVGRVARVVQLTGLHLQVRDPEPLHTLQGHPMLDLRVRGGSTGHGEHPVPAQHVHGECRQEDAVHAPRVAHTDRAAVLQDRGQLVPLPCQCVCDQPMPRSRIRSDPTAMRLAVPASRARREATESGRTKQPGRPRA